MNTLTINALKSYNVIVGEHLIANLGSYASSIINPGKAAVISDSNTWTLYGTKVSGSLAQAGFNIYDYILPTGEQSKNGDTYLKLLGYLAENHIQQTDIIIALGGGVICDICGFVAATYLRGIAYIQLPTTLLAMISSSTGGVASINLPSSRNVAGTVYHPSLVICDTTTLNSLGASDLKNGYAEIIKYSIISDNALFAHMQAHLDNFDREYAVSRCIQLKSKIIEGANSEQALLDFGQTIGHAIEITDNYMTSYGSALALGIAAACRTSSKLGFCDNSLTESVLKLLTDLSLPVGSAHTVDDIYDSALSHKMYEHNMIKIILPKEIGQCVVHTTDSNGLRLFIENGL